MGYLFIKIIVTDSFLTSVENISGCSREEAATAASSLNLEKIVDDFYLSTIKVTSKENLSRVADFMYGHHYKEYEQAIVFAVQQNQQKLAGAIAMLCETDGQTRQ